MLNLGKKFEDVVRKALLADNVCFDRLPDQVSGLAGSTNPCDFTAYDKPWYFYIECKECQSERFDVKTRISENQWIDLLKKSKYKGVHSGYLIWFVNAERIYWVKAVDMERAYKKSKMKSFTTEDFESIGYPVPFIIKGKYPVIERLTKIIAAAGR